MVAGIAAIVVAAASIAWAISVLKNPAHVDKRDPRCDTAARYEAMSEGADCS